MKTTKRPNARKIIVSLAVLMVMFFAFRLSFDAQTRLAYASGIDLFVVDFAIATAYLVGIWVPDLEKAIRVYLWSAIGVWSATSVLGNALHLYALPEGRITVPIEVAIGVNTVPAVTLFVILHITRNTVLRPDVTIAAPVLEPPRSRKPRPAIERTPSTRSDIPEVTDEQLLGMADGEHMSMQQIADRIGRSKSYVGDRVKKLREARDVA